MGLYGVRLGATFIVTTSVVFALRANQLTRTQLDQNQNVMTVRKASMNPTEIAMFVYVDHIKTKWVKYLVLLARRGQLTTKSRQKI